MEEMQNKTTETGRKRIRKSPQIPAYVETGKLPPQAVDLEEAVLGALMLEREAVNDAIDILSPKSFYKDDHQKIFAAIQDLFQKSEPVDILTVTEELKKRGELDFVGGPYYISQLTNRVASAANVEYHARIITQKHILRELIRISSETTRDAYEDTTDVFDLLDKTERDIFSITEGNLRTNYEKMSVLLETSIEKIEEMRDKAGGLSGVPSGFAQLDSATSGFQNSDLIIIAARPSIGKTAFVMSIARNAAVDFKKPVGFFSLEMSSLQLVNRLISSETELDSKKLQRGELAEHEWTQLHTKITQLAEAPIFIDDTPALSIFELRAKCRRLKSKHNVELFIVDYMQLMTTAGENKGNREQEISNISRSMKSIAKELNVPIIALSQLNRQVETRSGDKRPQLADLRESGAIEQDADLVMFIYRPEKHGLTEDEHGNPTAGRAEIIIAKHRNGATARIPMRFVEHFAKFVDDDADGFASSDMVDFTQSESEGSIIKASKMNDVDDESDEKPF